MRRLNHWLFLPIFLSLSFLVHSCTNTEQSNKPQTETPTEKDTDQLPSWKDDSAKTRILDFIALSTDPQKTSFVPPEDRIAVFDNDGTLWCEQPVYFQLLFALDQVQKKADQHPEWKGKMPFQAVLEHDKESMAKFSMQDIMTIVGATHAGMTQEEFTKDAKEFLQTFHHPEREKLLIQMVYQPMLELIDLLHKNEFKVFIVSGGGRDFIRAFSEDIYGIPADRVIGTTMQATFEFDSTSGEAKLIRQAEIVPPIDDKEGKPVNLYRTIGQRPLLAVGNSDGDIQMLQFATGMGIILHHDDADREYAYDSLSSIGQLKQGFKEAEKWDWLMVSMRNDFKTVFPDNHSSQEQNPPSK